MPSSTRIIKSKIDRVLDAQSRLRGDNMVTKILPNGHIVVMPANDEKIWMKQYKGICKDVNNVNNRIEEDLKKAEEQAIGAVALRAFLRPSKEKFQNSVLPSVPWSNIRHCWKSMGYTTPIREFWQPVPGVICGWKEKLRNMIAAYKNAKLLENTEINVKIGIDGTNIWKINLETISFSFAAKENQLYNNPNAAHIVGLYVGKENRISLGKLNFFYKNLTMVNGINDIEANIILEVNNINYNIHFYTKLEIIIY